VGMGRFSGFGEAARAGQAHATLLLLLELLLMRGLIDLGGDLGGEPTLLRLACAFLC
jgi:hypothetical protein